MRPPALAYVYLLTFDDGLLKIGFTTNPKMRIYQLERNSGRKVVSFFPFLTCKNYAEVAERYCHWQLRHDHVTGELFETGWHKAPRTIQRAIVLAEGGFPLLSPLEKPGRKWHRKYLPTPSCHLEKAAQKAFASGEPREANPYEREELRAQWFSGYDLAVTSARMPGLG